MKTLKSISAVALLIATTVAPCFAKIHSSIQIPFAKGTPDSQEEANTPRLLKLAKISKDQAKQIALAKYKGKFGKIDLENEDGNLIWSVEIGSKELAIDAGTGKILQVE